MTVPSLISLSIENLRGSVTPFTLSFDKGKKLVIIYGENGTGKSTVSDAFDLLGNGEVGSLDTRGLGSTRRYWPSIGKKASDVNVTLETTAGICSVSLGKSDVVVSNESLRPQVAVLRRTQILRLIEAKAADRYREISRFIDVSEVEASEGTLRKLILDKEREYNTASTRVSENRVAIERFWEEAAHPGTSDIAWARQEIQKDQTQIDQRKAVADRLVALWDQVVSYPQKVTDLTSQLKEFEAALDAAQQRLTALQGSMASDYLEVLDILKAAQTHFRNHPNPSVCPLCESSEKVHGLVTQVTRRIESQGQHNKLEAAKRAVDGNRKAVEQAQQRVVDARTAAAHAAAEFEAYCTGADVTADIPVPTFPLAVDIAQWDTWIAGNQDKRDLWARAAEACVADKKFVAVLRTSLKALDDNEQRARDLEALLPRLNQTLELLERERKKFTDSILSTISTRVGELYEAIHPCEGLNKIFLALDAAKRASLDIATEFGGQADAPPQAYFSDSHLDTLGLCVFLALAERDGAAEKILVLDDVLGSVDEPHVERIVGVIYEVSQRFRHAIVTTHYRPWREKFRWGVLKPDQVCHFVELNHWTFDKGISLSGAVASEIARLKVLLTDQSPDIQAISSKAGVILEALLDFITLQYGCSVPRKPGHVYEIGGLLSSINGKLLDALKAEVLDGGKIIVTTQVKPILDEIRGIFQTRNVLGAHFNSAAFDLYPADGIRFAKLVEQLSDALVCPDHGRPLKDTGSYWKNGGDTRRLHPLKKPS